MEKNKVQRKWLAHFIDSNFNSGTASYTRLGKDLEDYSIEMNPNSESKTNILGETTTRVTGYDPSGSIDTYYAYEGDELYTQLEKCINERETGSGLETTVVDVLLSSTGTVLWAYKEDAVIIPQSMGGDNSGVNIPFEIHYNGNRTKGTFDLDSKTFSTVSE